jgi:hypothetical protein
MDRNFSRKVGVVSSYRNFLFLCHIAPVISYAVQNRLRSVIPTEFAIMRQSLGNQRTWNVSCFQLKVLPSLLRPNYFRFRQMRNYGCILFVGIMTKTEKQDSWNGVLITERQVDSLRVSHHTGNPGRSRLQQKSTLELSKSPILLSPTVIHSAKTTTRLTIAYEAICHLIVRIVFGEWKAFRSIRPVTVALWVFVELDH